MLNYHDSHCKDTENRKDYSLLEVCMHFTKFTRSVHACMLK